MNNALQAKNIVLCVTGGIAAYKAAELASRLVKADASVQVVMTKAAQNFITPLTLREISRHPVNIGMWETAGEFQVEHVALADWADAVLVAPATANFIAKIAYGLADDMATTLILATKAPLVIAPAMNTNMYLHVTTQKNMAILRERGAHIITPATGHLACGREGIGRLPEPSDIVAFMQNLFSRRTDKSLSGKKIIVTAGGTIAPIDPVRFIGNRSSGKMGYAVAAAAQARGADVTLVSAPTHLTPPAGVKFVDVSTTAEMREAVLAEFVDAHVVVKAAAVADYCVKEVATQKIKKADGDWQLTLSRSPDILYELGQRKRPGQILVGFAAETENLLAYAQKKLREKNLDFIVANDVSRPGAGFNVDTNIACLIDKNGQIAEYPLMDKAALAEIILDKIEECLE